jgi:16S rRNA (uracil1498-N3)-methyltransferase
LKGKLKRVPTMSKRFFVAPGSVEGSLPAVQLDDSEAHHLVSVMRAKVGDEVVLFDGTGMEYLAQVSKLERRAAWLEITAKREISREPSTRLSLGVALPKGERQQWLCEKLVELGCHSLTPLYTERGVADPGEAALARLRRFVVEASKQCGRNRLMEICEPCTCAEFLAKAPEGSQAVILDAEGELISGAGSSQGLWSVAVGPEGGWSERELSSLREKKVRIASLGSRILRVETAAIAICARLCVD